MKHLILVLIPFLIARSACSQQQTIPHRWAFHSILNLGVLEAQDGSALQLQSVNGLSYRSWFAGIGVGLDEYIRKPTVSAMGSTGYRSKRVGYFNF